MVLDVAIDNLADLRHQAAARPEEVAFTFEGRNTTYGQLDRRTNRVANGLRALNSTPETRVATLSKNSDLFFEVLIGATKTPNRSARSLFARPR